MHFFPFQNVYVYIYLCWDFLIDDVTIISLDLITAKKNESA